MASAIKSSVVRSVKGKVMLGFCIAALALGTSWVISKIAFDNMLSKLEMLSTPSEKLRLVNKVFKNILQLDQLQNQRAAAGDTAHQQFLTQSGQLIASLDSLSLLCLDSPRQIIRLDSMKNILLEREKIYGAYVKVRSKLVSNQALSDEVKSISGLITTKIKKPDSTVVKTEKRTTTTTVYTEAPDSLLARQEEEKKGFLNRVFGSKKSKKAVAAAPAKLVRKQEVNVVVDTLTVALNEDSTIEKVGEAVQAIEKSQKARTTKFIDREHELNTAGSSLVQQLMRVMQEVEADVVQQTNDEGFSVRNMVSGSVHNLELVMIGFFCLIAFLAYLIFTDIAKSNQYRIELEAAKEEAEYHSMAKQRFLSNMSHEIRTPLQSIIGYTEALKKSDKPKQQDLETLHTASEHLLYLVNDVLDYSRIMSDQFTFEERTFAMAPVLSEVIQMLRPTAVNKSLLLTLNNQLPAGLLLQGDPFRIRQVLYNLLSNAIKFTETGEVSLHVSGHETVKGYRLEFKIADTGIGLTEDQLQRVFNQFEQADPTIARRYGGTGLGLSIVKALVEAMSGTINVASKPGEGTTFTVQCLLKTGEAILEAEEPKEVEPFRFSGKVWLVDDDAFILKWCSSVLELNGVEHMTFSSAEEALNQAWDDNVRVVLTDMRMPGMNGAELCKRMRKVTAPTVRFYVLTAQALPEERTMLLNMGFDGILMKPFHSHELLALLQGVEKTTVAKPEQDVQEIARPDFDFTALTEMTFGDESLLREILEQFVKDMRTDLQRLQEALTRHDAEELADIVHKLAGRSGQVGIRQLSEDLRKTEIDLRTEKAVVDKPYLEELCTTTAQIVDQVEEKALSYSI